MASANHASRIQFKHFDVVPLAMDHHYLYSKESNQISRNGRNALSIMKEWRILKNNLPESIYVQVYRTRIDLVRAAIIGSAGTPYHDGLFFFDIALPYDYPKSPPKVYYHSHGYRLNPNLYEEGAVCVSLINTWSDESTILQILVSIQGLVLSERPFFNEPMHSGKSMDWELMNASLDYNEDVFILSCETMLAVVRKPPQYFERFVVWHFRARAASILEAVEQYEEGSVVVGQFRSSGRKSSKFKARLADVKCRLRKAGFTGKENAVTGKENAESGCMVVIQRILYSLCPCLLL